VKAIFDLPADLWPASVDKGQVGRVIQNLALNAVQAMPEGGTLHLSARNDTVSALERPPLVAGRICASRSPIRASASGRST
jgi:signal transduction histidine kinase